jgi:hypothetical protein
MVDGFAVPARKTGKCLDVTIKRSPNELVVSDIHGPTPNDSLPVYCAFQGMALAPNAPGSWLGGCHTFVSRRWREEL